MDNNMRDDTAVQRIDIADRPETAVDEHASDEREDDEAGETPVGDEPETAPKPSSEEPVSFPPNPQGLTVEDHELDFIQQLHPLIASPRALKRFTNIYRFLRVQQRGADLDRFRGTAGRPGEFQVVALLLAAVVGYPAEATHWLRRLLTAHKEQWWEMSISAGGTHTTRDGQNEVIDEPTHEEESHHRYGRPDLSEALLKVKQTVHVADHSREIFAHWAREVARFSFQSGRILSVRDYSDRPGSARTDESTAAP